ncbi:MAG: hypothetical protein CMJ83_20045 [Planctomycetes bacterium]|nr:hypothetical protein [Planctomycetota bacterium]
MSRRKQRIWVSVLGTLVGLALLTWGGLWMMSSRDTDLTDPTAGVTASFRDAEGAGAPPIRFTDVASSLGVSFRHGPGPRGRTLPEDSGSGVAWGDADGDGDWDLYVVNFPGPLGQPPDPAGGNRLYRNDGGRFTDVSEAAGVVDLQGFGMGATFADYDGDGDQDLYVTNLGPNRLYRNRGDGTFEDVAVAAGVADPAWSTGATWGDFDRDGHLDLYLCNYVEYDVESDGDAYVMDIGGAAHGIPYTLNPNSFDPVSNRLFRNRGDGTFEDVAERLGVHNPEGRSLSAVLCDLDGDGWLDIYVNNDVSTNRLYRNLGGEVTSEGLPQFADLSAITGTADPRGSMGLSIAEIGGMLGEPDGLPDMFITHWIAQENALYLSVRMPGGGLEYRDKTRRLRLGEMSIDTVGWGCALVDLDRDGRPDLVVANGSTLEDKEDPRHLVPEPVFVLWNTGTRFVQVAASAGNQAARRHNGRGLAAADFDNDGDVDIAIVVNRGHLMLLRNETKTENRALKVLLRGTPAVCMGARVEVETVEGRQIRWWGADVTFLGMHASEMVFGLGESPAAKRVIVTWADGGSTTVENVQAGRLVVPRRGTPDRGPR